MSETSKRATVYFDPQLHAALRMKAAYTHRTVPDIVNEAVRADLAEDQEDLAAFEELSARLSSNAGGQFVRLDGKYHESPKALGTCLFDTGATPGLRAMAAFS